MRLLIHFLSFSFLCSPLFAADMDSLQKEMEKFQIELISPQIQVKKGEDFLVGLRIKIPEDWHSYWSFAGDFGQAPVINWRAIKNVKIDSLPFPTPKRKAFSINKKQSYSFIYEKELLIPFKVFVEESYKEDYLPLSLNLQWFVCKEICLPKEDSLALDLKIGEVPKVDSEVKRVFDSWNKFFPKKSNLKSHFKAKDNKLIISFFFEEELKCQDLFPKRREDFATSPPVLLSQSQDSCSFQAESSKSNLSKISGLFIYSNKQGEQQSALFQSYKRKGLGILWFIFMAFLGGLLLNIMPCVLPVIFLKFYNSLELKHLPQRKVLLLNLSYAFGVIVSFLFLAFVIFISKQTGESLGWGFHLQSPVFVTFLSLLFTLMAFYFLNAVSLPLLKVPLFFKEEKLFPHFMTGILSTTAASPCTVPFMASAMGFAFSRSYVEIFVIFFFLGLGLSSPYLILSFFPKALKYVPSPGRWTEVLKQLLSIPLFLTALWLMSILYQQVHLKLFLLSLMAFPLLLVGIFSQTIMKNPVIKQGLTFICVCLITSLFIWQNLSHSPLEKIPPPQKTLTQDLNWRAFDKNKILSDRQAGKNIFVAVGAEWCLTCKLNERLFKKQDFKDLIRKNQIQIYYGDWTSKTSEITEFLESYDQQGVPFYIFFKGEEELFIFSSLLFKDSFLQDMENLSNPSDPI